MKTINDNFLQPWQILNSFFQYGRSILNTSLIHKLGKISFLLASLNFIASIAKWLRLEKFIERSILLIIRGYKCYISPHKGFVCAYRKLYDRQSCSSYFYSCIVNHNLSTASNLFQQRLIDCKQASAILKADANYRQTQRRRKNYRNDECLDCGSWIDLSFFLPDCDDCGCDCDGNFCEFGGCDFNI